LLNVGISDCNLQEQLGSESDDDESVTSESDEVRCCV
jgi:hypothetical protein